jgi:hypothetical protein
MVANALVCSTFTDISGSEYKSDIDYASDRGWITCTDEFKPSEATSRREGIKMALRAGGHTVPETTEQCFSDVTVDKWVNDYICYAKDKGIISANAKFNPSEDITFEEASKMIIKSMNTNILLEGTETYFDKMVSMYGFNNASASDTVKRDYFVYIISEIEKPRINFINPFPTDIVVGDIVDVSVQLTSPLLSGYSVVMEYLKRDGTKESKTLVCNNAKSTRSTRVRTTYICKNTMYFDMSGNNQECLFEIKKDEEKAVSQEIISFGVSDASKEQTFSFPANITEFQVLASIPNLYTEIKALPRKEISLKIIGENFKGKVLSIDRDIDGNPNTSNWDRIKVIDDNSFVTFSIDFSKNYGLIYFKIGDTIKSIPIESFSVKDVNLEDDDISFEMTNITTYKEVMENKSFDKTWEITTDHPNFSECKIISITSKGGELVTKIKLKDENTQRITFPVDSNLVKVGVLKRKFKVECGDTFLKTINGNEIFWLKVNVVPIDINSEYNDIQTKDGATEEEVIQQCTEVKYYKGDPLVNSSTHEGYIQGTKDAMIDIGIGIEEDYKELLEGQRQDILDKLDTVVNICTTAHNYTNLLGLQLKMLVYSKDTDKYQQLAIWKKEQLDINQLAMEKQISELREELNSVVGNLKENIDKEKKYINEYITSLAYYLGEFSTENIDFSKNIDDILIDIALEIRTKLEDSLTILDLPKEEKKYLASYLSTYLAYETIQTINPLKKIKFLLKMAQLDKKSSSLKYPKWMQYTKIMRNFKGMRKLEIKKPKTESTCFLANNTRNVKSLNLGTRGNTKKDCNYSASLDMKTVESIIDAKKYKKVLAIRKINPIDAILFYHYSSSLYYDKELLYVKDKQSKLTKKPKQIAFSYHHVISNKGKKSIGGKERNNVDKNTELARKIFDVFDALRAKETDSIFPNIGVKDDGDNTMNSLEQNFLNKEWNMIPIAHHVGHHSFDKGTATAPYHECVQVETCLILNDSTNGEDFKNKYSRLKENMARQPIGTISDLAYFLDYDKKGKRIPIPLADYNTKLNKYSKIVANGNKVAKGECTLKDTKIKFTVNPKACYPSVFTNIWGK